MMGISYLIASHFFDLRVICMYIHDELDNKECTNTNNDNYLSIMNEFITKISNITLK